MANQFLSQISLGTQAVLVYTGNGSPEGVETAPVGSVYLNATASNAANTLYVKGSGTGNTGWALLSASTIPAGSDTEIQFNDAGVSAGDPQLTWNKTTNTITIGSTNNAGTILVKDQGEVRFEEDNPSGTNYVSLKSPATLASNISLTLPNGLPGASSGFLVANSTGSLYFATTSRLLYNDTTGGIELTNGGDNGNFFLINDSTLSPMFSVGYDAVLGINTVRSYSDFILNNSSRILSFSDLGNPTEIFTLYSGDTFYFGPYDIDGTLSGLEMQVRYGRGNVGSDSAIAISGVNYYINIPLRSILVPPPRASATNPKLFHIDSSLAIHTAVVAGDVNDVHFALNRNVQFTTGSTISATRAFYVNPPTFTATSATQTITHAATLSVSGAPVKGTNVAITNTSAIRVEAAAVSTATNSYGLYINLQTGATNNYGAYIAGRVGINETSPTASLSAAAASASTAAGRFSGESGQSTNILEVATKANNVWLFNNLANVVFTPEAQTSGSPVSFTMTGAAHTGLTASTEVNDLNFNLDRTVQFATGTLTTQRAIRIQAPTYGFVAASALTTASTLSISGAPKSGTNTTTTNAIALNVEAGAVAPVGTTTNSYGLYVNAQTGATNNYAATLTGGFVGIGTAAPTGIFNVVSSSASSNNQVNVENHSNNNTPPMIMYVKSRGTQASPSAVVSSDFGGIFGFRAADSVNTLRQNAMFGIRENGTIGNNSVPAEMFFAVTSGFNSSNCFIDGTVNILISSETYPDSSIITFNSNVKGTAQVNIFGSNGGLTPAYSQPAARVTCIIRAGTSQTADILQIQSLTPANLWTASIAGDITSTPIVRTTGSPTLLTITGPAHTTLTASTEATDINFNLARIVQFSTGALTTQRAVRIQAPTYGFVGASVITTASTVSISGAPITGTNATITNAYALNIESGKLQTAATTTTTAGFNLPHGTAPSSPVNGDLWTTTAGLYARINGSTVGPYGTGGSGSPGGSNTHIQYNNSGSFAGSSDLTWVGGSVARITINSTNNAGIGLSESSSLKWTLATYSSGTFTFYNETLAEEAIGITSASIITMNRKVGVGISPTAYFHVKAGTAAANTAPIKLTSGTNLTAIEAGVFEYDGSALYFSPTSSIRHSVTPVESSPATITSNQNDYVIPNASLIRLTSDVGNRQITGIAGGYAGRRITLRNVNASNNIVLLHQSASSAAANRFILQGGVSKTLFAAQIVTFVYDNTTQRWIEEYDFTAANMYRAAAFQSSFSVSDANFYLTSSVNSYGIIFNLDVITVNGSDVVVRMPDDVDLSYDITLLGYTTGASAAGTSDLPFAASNDGAVSWRTIDTFDLPASVAYLNVAQTFTASQIFRPTTSAAIGLVVRGVTSQSANLQEWQTATPTTVASVSSTGLFAAPLGSNTAPSYAILGDTNTGMYSSGTDVLDFTTGGTNRLRLDSSGNILVNSASAIGRISVAQNTNSIGISFAAGAATWGIWLGSESIPYFYIAGNGGTSQYFWRANWNDTTDAGNTFKSASDTNAQNVMEVRGTASQTGRLQQWTRAGTLVSNINSHGDWTINPAVRTTGSPNALLVTGAAHTTLAASTEASDIYFNLARTVQFSAGALATQRAIRIAAPTYAFASSSTITDASTVAISGAPAAGTNATITRSYALSIESGAIALRNEGALHMFESSGLGNHRIAFKAASDLVSDSTYSWPVLPTTTPTGAGQWILTGNSGTLAWTTLTNVQLGARVYNEVPSGTVNGSNAVFSTADTPEAGTLRVYKNGLRQKPGSGNDYTLFEGTITFESGNIPQTGDVLLVDYVVGDMIA